MRNEVLSMKRHPLDIAIIVCLILIVILVIILLWPENKSSKDTSSKDTKEVVEKVDSKDQDKDTGTDTLFVDTSNADNEEEVVSYIEDVERQVTTLTNDSSSKPGVKKTLEDTFITLTDFIFYGGTIQGVTFDELTDSAKMKVLTLYEKMDSAIEEKFPNYKENIAATTKKGYTTVVSKAKELKDTIVSKYHEKVGDSQYNNVVSSYEEDKNRFQDAYTPYVEKGKDAASVVLDKGKTVFKNTIDKLDDWYQGFKESRE